MSYYSDPMMAELHQFRVDLWERSGHNLHKMVQIIEQEAHAVMLKYGKVPPESVNSPYADKKVYPLNIAG